MKYRVSKLHLSSSKLLPRIWCGNKYLLPGLLDRIHYQTSIKSRSTTKLVDLKYTNLNRCRRPNVAPHVYAEWIVSQNLKLMNEAVSTFPVCHYLWNCFYIPGRYKITSHLCTCYLHIILCMMKLTKRSFIPIYAIHTNFKQLIQFVLHLIRVVFMYIKIAK